MRRFCCGCEGFGLCRVGPGNFTPSPPHRSGLDTLPSSGSCHRTKAAAFRRELELLLFPVGSLPTAMTCPLRSTSITPALALLQGSPHLYGASVLSASRLEPLAPCMGLSESSRDLSSPPLSFFLSFVPSLCSTGAIIPSSRPALRSRRV